jgi:hypothetical protein
MNLLQYADDQIVTIFQLHLPYQSLRTDQLFSRIRLSNPTLKTEPRILRPCFSEKPEGFASPRKFICVYLSRLQGVCRILVYDCVDSEPYVGDGPFLLPYKT